MSRNSWVELDETTGLDVPWSRSPSVEQRSRNAIVETIGEELAAARAGLCAQALLLLCDPVNKPVPQQ